MLVVALMDEWPRNRKARGMPYPPIGRLRRPGEDARGTKPLPWDRERTVDLYPQRCGMAQWRGIAHVCAAGGSPVGKGDGGTDDALLRVSVCEKYKKAPER